MGNKLARKKNAMKGKFGANRNKNKGRGARISKMNTMEAALARASVANELYLGITSIESGDVESLRRLQGFVDDLPVQFDMSFEDEEMMRTSERVGDGHVSLITWIQNISDKGSISRGNQNIATLKSWTKKGDVLTLDVDFDGMAIMKAIDQESVEVEINHHQLKFKEEERVITKVWIIPRNVNFKGIGAKMPSSGSERSHTSDRLPEKLAAVTEEDE